LTPRRRYLALVAVSFLAFISLGLPDGVLGVAWPSIRASFSVPVSRLGVLLIFGTAGYLVASSLVGPIMRRTGIGKLLCGSTVVAGTGLLLFAVAPTWWWLPVGAIAGGLGAGGIDAGLNTFVSERCSARIVSWLHASWGIGTTLGPLLVTGVLMLELSWRIGYAVAAGVMGLLAVLFACTLNLWTVHAGSEHQAVVRAPLAATLRRPLAWLHIGIFSTYCALESSAGQLTYTLMVEGRGVRPEVAGPVVGGYWASLTIGRVILGQSAAHWSRDAILRIGTFGAPLGIVLLLWHPSDLVSFAGLWILGFALAPIFPMLISATPDRLGREHGANAVGVQMAAGSLGVAVLPGLAATLMRSYGHETLPVFLLVLALAILVLQEAAVKLTPRAAT
jgi:MFS family permease